MNCCNGNCNQGRDCPAKKKPGDLWIILALELAPLAAVCIAALVGGRIAGMW